MLYNAFKRAVDRFPENIAVVADGQRLTYAALDAGIDALASQLCNRGLSSGDAVLVLLPNSVEFVTSIFALMKCGMVAVPVNTRFPAQEIEYYIETSGARAVVHTAEHGAMLETIAPGVCAIDIATLTDGLPLGESVAGLPEVTPQMSALYMYSSGSTGKPKRVTRTHQQIFSEAHALTETIALSERDAILCTVPLYHAHGFSNTMMAALLNGGKLVIMSGEFNPREALRAVEREGITIYPAVPFMFKMIGETFFKQMPDIRSLRLAFSAGAALPHEIWERFKQTFDVDVRQLYGSSETGAVAINYQGGEGSQASVGLPLQGVVIEVLDEAGQPLGADQVGEIAINSPAMTHQYDGLPDVTAECFKHEWFMPGDLATKDASGRIYITGRKKLLINVAGYKVDPLDVETVIKDYPKVADVVVVGTPDANYGEMVKAVVVAGEACNPQEIIDHCAARLAEYKVPKRVEFRDEIPRSPLGKVLRKYL